jgi:hypothetical protein
MSGFHCSQCGEYHDQLPMSFGAAAPAAWYAIPEPEREQRAQLSSDQCIIDGKYFFLLGRLQLPVVDSPEPFVWLTWVSVSEENFNRASDFWHRAGRESEHPYFAWIQSELPYQTSTLALRASLQTQPVGCRPLVDLEPCDHPLAIEQQTGIDMTRVREIVQNVLHGNDV